jgi:hypothetical protein
LGSVPQHLNKLVTRCVDRFLNKSFAVAASGINKELARRDGSRGDGTFQWFTPEEAVVAEALARIIVPSDETSPGIDEVGVLDAPAIVTLDKLVGSSPWRQHLYSRGLLSFDVWALKKRGCKFSELPKGGQIDLFRCAQRINKGRAKENSALRKAWRRLQSIIQVRQGAFFAA